MAKGGKRPGSGRKKKPPLPIAEKKQAESVLELLGTTYKGKQIPTEHDLWISLMCSPDQRIRLDALKYLTDRREGKPIQRIAGADDGPIAVAVEVSFVRPNSKD